MSGWKYMHGGIIIFILSILKPKFIERFLLFGVRGELYGDLDSVLQKLGLKQLSIQIIMI